MPRTTDSNDLCPDYVSHQENASDRLFPDAPRVRGGARLLTFEQDELVTAEADAEYLACEGH